MSSEEQAVGELKAIVDQFNKDFKDWSERHNMVVKFGYQYGSEGKAVKSLEIQGIDKIIWRKPPPNWKKIQEAMDNEKEVREVPQP